MEIKEIAHIYTDFPDKFGIPRQSGLIKELCGKIVFEPEYRNQDALRGLDGYSYIWLIWGFHKNKEMEWSPTVRPPRLGGNRRMGVFATRSPNRPNPLGLSCVKIKDIIMNTSEGPVITVLGPDMANGTPIYDIKPYLPQTESHINAEKGFSANTEDYKLDVLISKQYISKVRDDKLGALIGILENDPRPSYQNDPDRIYGVNFAGMNIKFKVNDRQLIVCGIEYFKET